MNAHISRLGDLDIWRVEIWTRCWFAPWIHRWVVATHWYKLQDGKGRFMGWGGRPNEFTDFHQAQVFMENLYHEHREKTLRKAGRWIPQ